MIIIITIKIQGQFQKISDERKSIIKEEKKIKRRRKSFVKANHESF